jgi:hypothetical protein
MVMSRHVELPKRLADAIKRTWPDGVVEMMDLEEETSVHKACSKLQTRLSRLPGSNLVFERAAGVDHGGAKVQIRTTIHPNGPNRPALTTSFSSPNRAAARDCEIHHCAA